MTANSCTILFILKTDNSDKFFTLPQLFLTSQLKELSNDTELALVRIFLEVVKSARRTPPYAVFSSSLFMTWSKKNDSMELRPALCYKQNFGVIVHVRLYE